MRLRVLLSGLTFFLVALALGVLPALAHAHALNPWKPCTKTGTAGADNLFGTAGPDVLCGLGGNDALAGLGGDDILRGGPGADRMQGDAGGDAMLGGDGNDVLYSYDGTHDHVNGGAGYDRAPRRDRSRDLFSSIESFS
jgi:Ca2+-binding RTX toxin-like protein